MKKLVIGLAVVIVFLMAIGVYAETNLSSDSTISSDSGQLSSEEKAQIEQKVSDVSTSPALAESVRKYVEEFAKKRGIKAEQINDISEVDFNSLPKEVNIENVNDANLAIYNVDYNETTGEGNTTRQLYVVTYSTKQLNDQGDLIVSRDVRQFLNFGSEGQISNGFLKTATGVVGSLESGYVMMRAGGITGISTSLDVLNSSSGNIEIIIYKNGEPIGFGNTIDASTAGIKKDYDTQSKNIVTFQPGDIISAYILAEEGISADKVITMVEITTVN